MQFRRIELKSSIRCPDRYTCWWTRESLQVCFRGQGLATAGACAGVRGRAWALAGAGGRGVYVVVSARAQPIKRGQDAGVLAGMVVSHELPQLLWRWAG